MKGFAKWKDAFPLAQADRAVGAIVRGWNEAAARHRPAFNHTCREPELTLYLKQYVSLEVARKLGLMGFWSAEPVESPFDFEKGEKKGKQHRVDIQYVWNSDALQLHLIFEFKKLDSKGTSRNHYVGSDGMLRFITGDYAKQNPLALMVGILMESREDCVPPLRHTLELPSHA